MERASRNKPIDLVANPRGLAVDVKLRQRTDNGAWFVDFRDIEGNRMRVTLPPVDSPRDAEKAAYRLFRTEEFQAAFAPPEERGRLGSDTTVSDVVDYYVDTYLVATGKAEKTIQAARGILSDFEAYCHAEKRFARMSRVTRPVVDEWCVSLAKRGNVPKTISNKLMMLRAAFRAAVDAKLIDADPIQKWNIKKHEAEEIHPLEPEELTRLLRLTEEQKPVIANIIKWIAYTGNRPSDAVALRWSQVSMKTRTVERKQVKVKRLAQYQLSDDAMNVLKAQKANKNRAGQDFVFIDGYGEPFSVNTLYKHFTRMQEAAKCERIVAVKDLRHTFGYIMANYAKCPLPVLQVLMGHAKVETTMMYVRASDAAPFLSEYGKLIGD